jgi:hypothetical protein
MGLWYRVFGSTDAEVTPDSIRSHLAGRGVVIGSQFASDDAGWIRAEIRFAQTTPLHLERFQVGEPGIRGELNTWAAFLETCDYDPIHVSLMERVIQTKQLFTLRRPVDHADEVLVEGLCVGLCCFLASATEGLWQSDDEGFFAADGTLLLKEY